MNEDAQHGVAVGRSGLIFDKPAYPDNPTHWPHPAYRSPAEYVPVWHLVQGSVNPDEVAVA